MIYQIFFLLVAVGFAQSAPGVLTHVPPGSPAELRRPDQTLPNAGAGAVAVVAYSVDGNTLATVDGKTVKLWDVKTGKVVRDLEGRAVAVAFEPGGEPILADCTPQQVRLRNPQHKTFELGGKKRCSVAFSRDGKILAGSSDDGKVRLWDVATGAPIRTLDAGCPVGSVAISTTLVAAACENGTVKLWALDSDAPAREVSGHRQAVHAVAFSPDGAQLATASTDRSIKVWEAKTGRLLSTLLGHEGSVLSIAFSPNGRTIASGGADRTVRYWTMPLPPIGDDDLKKIEAAIPSKPTAAPKKPRRVLVFWRADAIQHKGGVPAANAAIALLAKKTGAFEVDFSRDYDALDPKVLPRYDAIIMNSTAHLAIPDEGKKKALLDYVRGGGGVVGIHAAIDTFKDWPAGAEVIGATFAGHPFVPSGHWAVKIERPDHPLTRAFGGKGFVVNDEVYEMGEPYTRADRRVLLSLDLSDPATAAIMTPRPGKESIHRADHDFAVSWIKRYGAGKVFYAVFGHVVGPFQNRAIVQFYLDGIQYVLGDLAVDSDKE